MIKIIFFKGTLQSHISVSRLIILVMPYINLKNIYLALIIIIKLYLYVHLLTKIIVIKYFHKHFFFDISFKLYVFKTRLKCVQKGHNEKNLNTPLSCKIVNFINFLLTRRVLIQFISRRESPLKTSKIPSTVKINFALSVISLTPTLKRFNYIPA